jgi:hypothetical protein
MTSKTNGPVVVISSKCHLAGEEEWCNLFCQVLTHVLYSDVLNGYPKPEILSRGISLVKSVLYATLKANSRIFLRFTKGFEPGGDPSPNSTFCLTHFVITTRGMKVPSALLHTIMYILQPLSLEVNAWIPFASFVASNLFGLLFHPFIQVKMCWGLSKSSLVMFKHLLQQIKKSPFLESTAPPPAQQILPDFFLEMTKASLLNWFLTPHFSVTNPDDTDIWIYLANFSFVLDNENTHRPQGRLVRIPDSARPWRAWERIP